LAAGIVFLFGVCPWPLAKRAPALVQYAPLTIVRAGSAGFVREVIAEDGQSVAEGDLLLVLENEQLEIELKELDVSVEQSRLKSLGHRNRHEMAAYQAEQKKIEGLLKQRAELQAQVEQLAVRAPSDGTVMRRQLDALLGTYLNEGDEILAIGNDDQKEIRLSVAQEDVDSFQCSLDEPVLIHVGSDRLLARLTRITPRATLQPPDVSLCATHGGPLVVRQNSPDAKTDSSENETVELVEPRFTGTIALDGHQSRQLRAGGRGVVHLTDRDESVGGHLVRSFQRWLRRRLAAGQS
jgi:putative peptide zinc metalloprotease protein